MTRLINSHATQFEDVDEYSIAEMLENARITHFSVPSSGRSEQVNVTIFIGQINTYLPTNCIFTLIQEILCGLHHKDNKIPALIKNKSREQIAFSDVRADEADKILALDRRIYVGNYLNGDGIVYIADNTEEGKSHLQYLIDHGNPYGGPRNAMRFEKAESVRNIDHCQVTEPRRSSFFQRFQHPSASAAAGQQHTLFIPFIR